MDRYTEPTQSLPVTLPQMLKPFLRVNYILGTFPYMITFENGRVALSKKSIHYYRSLFTVFLIIGSVIAMFLRTMQVVFSPRTLDSNGKPTLTMSRVIELVCSVHANFITMVILLLLLLKRKTVKKYLSEMLSYAETLRGYTDYAEVYSTLRKLSTLYAFLGIMTAVSVAVRYSHNPVYAPISVWLEVFGLDYYVTPNVLSAISGAFVFYLAIVKFACLGYLEVISCTQATCLSRTMENIMEYLESQMQIWKRQLKGVENQMIDKDDFLNLLASTSPEPRQPSSKSSSKFKLHNDFEDYIDQIREFNPGLIAGISPSSSPSSPTTTGLASSKISSGMCLSGFKTTPGRALGHAARKYLNVASMQNIANSVFGNTHAINIGCTVIMLVILKYLVITSFIGHWKEHHLTSQQGHGQSFHQSTDNGSYVENWTTTEMTPVSTDDVLEDNTTSSIDPDYITPAFFQWNSYHLDSTSLEWLVFLGLYASMFTRLSVTVICLGRVHKTSLQFNQVMGKTFLTANKIIDEIATTLSSNNACGGGGGGTGNGKDIDEITKLLMTPTQMSSILAFMNLNNANPAAFTAGGLFVFSRGLLLMIISIIVSYLVFLLQASKNGNN